MCRCSRLKLILTKCFNGTTNLILNSGMWAWIIEWRWGEQWSTSWGHDRIIFVWFPTKHIIIIVYRYRETSGQWWWATTVMRWNRLGSIWWLAILIRYCCCWPVIFTNRILILVFHVDNFGRIFVNIHVTSTIDVWWLTVDDNWWWRWWWRGYWWLDEENKKNKKAKLEFYSAWLTLLLDLKVK